MFELTEGPGRGDPVVQFSAAGSGENQAFAMLREVVEEMASKGAAVFLSGLKNQLRKKDSSFTEKKFGYAGFLQFCKAAATSGAGPVAQPRSCSNAYAARNIVFSSSARAASCRPTGRPSSGAVPQGTLMAGLPASG